jgi:hypothetical protein
MWSCPSNIQRHNRKLITDKFKESVVKLIKPPPNLIEWVTEALEHIPCLAKAPLLDGILLPKRYLFPLSIFPEERLKLEELSKQTQDITLAQLAGGLAPTSLRETVMIIANRCHDIRFTDQNVIFDPKQVEREYYSIQKALYRDFHEYWLERCEITIAWERENNITQAKKMQKKQTNQRETATPEYRRPIKKPKTQDKTISRPLMKRTQYRPSTEKAMSFVLRRPTKDKHNKFIHDYSKKTVSKKIRTAERALPTPETKEDRKRNIELKRSLPELPPSDNIRFEDSDDDANPPRKRPKREPPDKQSRSQEGSPFLS